MKKHISQASKLLFSWFSIGLLIAVGTSVFLAQPAKANCIYAEESYPTGAQRGSYVCMPDGSWQQQ